MNGLAGLGAILVALSDPAQTSVEQRRHAESSLWRMISAWLPNWIERNFPVFRGNSIVIEGIVEHVRDRATSGTRRFRGEYGDRSAFNWVTRVARNHAIDAMRRAERKRCAENALAAEARAAAEEADDQREREALTKLVLALVRDVVERQYSDEEHDRWAPRIEMSFDIVWVTSGKELLEKYGYLAPRVTDESVVRKADARAAQHRRRARQRVSRILGQLLAAGRLDEGEAATFAAINRIPWPPGAVPAMHTEGARAGSRDDTDD